MHTHWSGAACATFYIQRGPGEAQRSPLHALAMFACPASYQTDIDRDAQDGYGPDL